MLRIIVTGSRDFEDYEKLEYVVASFLKNIKGKVEILSGGERGADQLGEKYARKNNLKIKRIVAEWDDIGRLAGSQRNEKLATRGDVLIAFWNGESAGTEFLITIAEQYGLFIKVIKHQPKQPKKPPFAKINQSDVDKYRSK